MSIQWPDAVDSIIGGDHAVMLAYVTPAKGVVLLPVTNFGVRDRGRGTVTVNSSVGAWKKLARMRADPHVSLVYHTRDHALTDRPEYVLVQGMAALSEPIPDYPSTMLEAWERFEPWSDMNRLWNWWMRAYGLRVAIEVTAERVVVWPDLACTGPAEVHGAPLPATHPDPQRPPAKGTGPRINQARAARKAARLPHVLLGWVGADGFPDVAPVRIGGAGERGMLVDVPDGVVPPGGRRAGLTAHWFSEGVIGQRQRKHTGWLEADAGDRRVVYAPHTDASYNMPPSRTVYRLAAGLVTRRGARSARGAGCVR
jgi:hypothetical protein